MRRGKYDLQTIAEWIQGLVRAGNPVVTEMSPVWTDALGSPAAVGEFTMTLDSGQRYNVTVREVFSDDQAVSYNLEDAIPGTYVRPGYPGDINDPERYP